MEEKMIGDEQYFKTLEMEEQMVILQNRESDFIYYRRRSQQDLNKLRTKNANRPQKVKV